MYASANMCLFKPERWGNFLRRNYAANPALFEA